MKSLIKITLAITLVLVGLTACNDEPKSKPDFTKSAKQEIHETFLQGEVSGQLNGKAFTFGEAKGRDSKIRTTGSQKSLVLSFVVGTYVVVIITSGYHGKGTYEDAMSLSPFLLITNPRDSFRTLEKKINITEDNQDTLSGDFSFKVASVANEEITVDGSFDYKKINIDLNDEAGLLSELKLNPPLMESLGKKRADKDFIIKAVNQNDMVFFYIDDALKKDKEFILRALKEGPKGMIAILMYVDKDLLRNKNFALEMLAINPNADYFLDKKLKQDKDIIKAAEKQ